MGCVLSCCGRSDVVSATATPPPSSPTEASPLLSPAPSKSAALVFDDSSADGEIATTSSPPPAMPVPVAARKGQDLSSGGPAPVAPGKWRPSGMGPLAG
ncbi:hypothetical protein LTR10_011414 [Elasticomyces elasticus]|nr:hypothetical protein LTR10_011414 [Elasticomyces elasticus]KAK4966175.1 hypothetical protein LTR42_011336 [Elasticomyces elasticus]